MEKGQPVSGYIINDEILLATDIEAAKESARLDAKRKARKERKVEKRRAKQLALAAQHDSRKRRGRRR